MDSSLGYLRYAGRVLQRSPGFAVAALSTLALGVGGVIALSSLIYGILLRPLPYPDSDALMLLHWKSREGVAHAASTNKFLFWRERFSSFSRVAAFELKSSGTTLVGGEVPEYVRTLRVSGEFFRTLGIVPVLGRDFLPEEDRPGGPGVLILGHELWRNTFDASPAVLGAPLNVSGQSYTVVGVLPAGFQFEPPADIWIPLQAAPVAQGGANLYVVLGRLEKGVTLERAKNEAKAVFDASRREATVVGPDDTGVYLGSLKEWIVGDVRLDLWLLFGAGCLVFLICCINLSNLFMARAISRAGETATRMALGADWRQILWQVIIENLLIAIAAVLLGIWLAKAVISTVVILGSNSLPRTAEVRIGPSEVLGAGFVVIVTTVLIALLSMVRAGWNRAGGWVRSSLMAWSHSSRITGRQFGRVFVVCEIALALAVLASSLLMIRTFMHLRSVNPGFDVENVTSFQVPLQGEQYQHSLVVWSFSEDLQQRIKRIRGVSSSAAVTSLPLETGLNVPLRGEGRTGGQDIEAEYRAVSPEYFRCLEIPLRGEGFSQANSPSAAAVAIVNETLARRLWGRESAIGQTVWIAKGLGPLEDRPRQIIGVAGDIHEKGLGIPPPPTIYVPLAQVSDALAAVINTAFPLSFLVRYDQPGTRLTDLRRVVQEVDPQQAIATIHPLSEVVRDSMSRERFYSLLLGIFGGFALWLTVVGIYGVTSSHVSRRTHEIGLRMAVGACKSEVLKLVLGETLRLSILGIAVGLPFALAVTRLIGHVVEGVDGSRPLSLALVSFLLVAVALAASYLPARNATRVDPLVALRHE